MADHQNGAAVPARRQRPADDSVSKSKRRKYIAVACDECRRRKLKCMPSNSANGCQRCVSKGKPACQYTADRAEAQESGRGAPTDGYETISSLKRDVQMLRDTLAGWMTAAREQGNPLGDAQRQHDTVPLLAISRPARESAGAAPSPRPAEAASMTAMPSITVAGASSTSFPTSTASYAVESGDSYGARGPRPTTPADPGWTIPEEPRFVGPTRSAYSLEAGDRALSRLGVPTFDVPLQSGQQTPAGAATPRQKSAGEKGQFWELCDVAEFARLIQVFQEEVESVYPCLQTDRLVPNAAEILQIGRMSEDAARDALDSRDARVSLKDVHLAKVAVATAIVIEGHGQTDDSAVLVAPVERSVLSIMKPRWELRDLQLLILMSIYYFHADQDLMAWRSIGLAAREALVMGLHRKATLMETFPDQEERDLAVCVYWTIYVLDRRWSFGTSLSFALVERDIDAELPEPGPNNAYLQCMVGYGRLCSVLWDALVPFGHRANDNPEGMTHDLDIKAQEWLESIPSDLRLRHPRLGLAARAQPPVLQRLRALLYLRGNHSRILVYRYYLLGPGRIWSSPSNAWLAVEIAQDSIQVLVHLNDSSEIYRRQQAAFNYFLLSALAVLFLAVCNDPETFATPCKKSLHSAINLLRHLSRHSWGSRRLWRSVRSIVPRLRYLENRRNEEHRARDEAAAGTGAAAAGTGAPPAAPCDAPVAMPSAGYVQADTLTMTTPDFGTVGDELMGLFETFEQGQMFAPPQEPEQPVDMATFWGNDFYNTTSFGSQDQGVISWQFDWLIQ